MKKIITFCCVLLLLSCEKDDSLSFEINQDTISQSKAQIKVGNNVSKSAINYIRLKTNSYFTVENRKNSISLSKSSLISKSTDLGIVDTSKEVMVINEFNTKHTFNVISPMEQNSVINLIVVESENSTYEYFIKYNFVGDIPINEESGSVDLSKFSGVIETYNSDGQIIGSVTAENGVITNDTGQLSPCPDEPADNPTDEPTDSSGSSSGSDSSAGIPGTNDDSSGTYNNTNSSSGGELVDADGDCGLSWSYLPCGCGGTANGHSPQEGVSCCQGSPLVITDCNGNVIAQRASNNSSTMFKRDFTDPCDDGDVGVIINTDEDCNTSKDDLKNVFPTTSDSRLQEIADAINEHAKDFGIDTKEELQHFIAQAGHESKKFVDFTEGLNYRVKKLGIDYWKSKFNPYTSYTDPPTTDIDSTKKNPNDYASSTSTVYVDNETFANFVYDDANRGVGYKLGNTSEGDGYKYRGRGIFQLTGKNNYTKFNTYYQENIDADTDLVTNPGLVASDKEIAVISALWFYKNNVLDKITIDSTTTVKEVSKKINGGENGLSDRKEIFEDCEEHIDCVEESDEN